jgi:DHA2 family methylenomycin A resistance protein-like MFS transporter
MTTHAIALERERPYGLYAICFGFFLVLFDTTALNVAIAAMHREFGGTISALQWIVSAYTIVFASLVLTCGALGDRYGARRLYQLGLTIFTVMSLACALSPNVALLIAFRMAQGLGAAMMLPASLALLSHLYPDPRARARAVSFWASIVSLGFAAGPALGGVFTSVFGWRSIFLLNVPTGLVALLMVRAFIEETRGTRDGTIDWLGQLGVSLTLWALSYALIEAGNAGWAAPRVLAAFAASITLAGVSALTERRSVSPVFPPALFSRPAFVACVGAGVVVSLGTYGILFIESIYLQNVRHLSALATGAMIVPLTGGAHRDDTDDRSLPRRHALQAAALHGTDPRGVGCRDNGAVRVDSHDWRHSARVRAARCVAGLHHARDDDGRADRVAAFDGRPGVRNAECGPPSRRRDRRGAHGHAHADAP